MVISQLKDFTSNYYYYYTSSRSTLSTATYLVTKSKTELFTITNSDTNIVILY